jgi:hypothetical protein
MTIRHVGACVVIVAALVAGCASETGSNKEETRRTAEAVAASGDSPVLLQYEGSCAWLKCMNNNNAAGAFNLGCDDSVARIVIPERGTGGLAGKALVNVCSNGVKATNVQVWDVSCCKHWEGNPALFAALNNTTAKDGTCNDTTKSFGSGEAQIKVYLPSDPDQNSDPACGSSGGGGDPGGGGGECDGCYDSNYWCDIQYSCCNVCDDPPPV